MRTAKATIATARKSAARGGKQGPMRANAAASTRLPAGAASDGTDLDEADFARF